MITLKLDIEDPDVTRYLVKNAGDNERAAQRALRVGVLAIESASGAIDVDAIRNEGQKLILELQAKLQEHARGVTTELRSELSLYLAPEKGIFRAVASRVLDEQQAAGKELQRGVADIFSDGGTLSKTLSRQIGEGSPLLRLLDPGQENGLRARIEKLMRDGVEAQRTAVLFEFSLDQPGSALSRLMSEIRESNQDLTGELSLDREDSALSRLVTRVEAAANQSTKALSLDYEDSALSRLAAFLKGNIDALALDQQAHHERVLEMLARFDEKKKVGRTGTQHGMDFEFALLNYICTMAEEAGDIFDATGNTTGIIRNCKVGDAVITVGPDHIGAGARVVWEAKEDQGYSRTTALAELETAMKNRDAGIGVFVFSKRTAPSGMRDFARHGNCLLVVWDQEDPTSDLTLTAAHSVATALLAREARQKDAVDFDFTKVDVEVADIEKQVVRVAGIREKCETIRRAASAIDEEARITSDKIGTSMTRLRSQVENLKLELA